MLALSGQCPRDLFLFSLIHSIHLSTLADTGRPTFRQSHRGRGDPLAESRKPPIVRRAVSRVQDDLSTEPKNVRPVESRDGEAVSIRREDLTAYCSSGAACRDERVVISPSVKLRLLTFTPPQGRSSTPVVLVAACISQVEARKEFLREMISDFIIHYVETRERISSEV